MDGPLEALEVGDEAAVAEIANFLLELVDLELLPVELLLQIPNLKLQKPAWEGGQRDPLGRGERAAEQADAGPAP